MKQLIQNKVTIIVLMLLTSLAIACTPTGSPSSDELTMFVGAETADCVGVVPQKCLLVKFDPDASWEYEYDGIRGLEHEQGFEYELRVRRVDVPNPPADGSSFYYELVEVVSKTAVSNADPLAHTSWILSSYGSAADPKTPLGETEITLDFLGNGQLGGSAGCNSYFGSYTVSADGSLQIQDVGATEMACIEGQIMMQESDFLAALTTVKSFKLDDSGLELMVKNGRLQFQPIAPLADQSLTGTNWQLTTFVTADTAASLLANTEITAKFDGERISGRAGCNNYFGPYTPDGSATVDGNAIAFGVIGSTMMACEEEVLAQEATYLQTLEAINEAAIEGEQLILRHPKGELIFAATAPDPTEQGNLISWEEALALINSGQVLEAYQSHNLEVMLVTADATYNTIEPEIDDIFSAISDCGEPCANMELATE